MKTKYLVTNTNPDDIDAGDFEDELEHCERFTGLTAAMKEFKRRVKGGTNMHVYLLKIELVDDAQGVL